MVLAATFLGTTVETAMGFDRGRTSECFRITTPHGLQVDLEWSARRWGPGSFLYLTPCCRTQVGFLGIARTPICRTCKSAVPLSIADVAFSALTPTSTIAPWLFEQGQRALAAWYGLWLDPLEGVLVAEELYDALQEVSFRREELVAHYGLED